MNTNPLVSILMTAYNREKYIVEAIESVLASSYSNWELIIVDDKSLDNTYSILSKYALADKRIRLYVNEQNLGDYPNRNRAASYAKGKYIMNVDSDDKIFSDGIEKCVKIMLLYPKSSFGMYLYNTNCEPYEITSETIIRKHFFEEPMLSMGPGGTVICRKFFESINKYPVKYGPANDMYFNLKAACNTSIVMLPFEFLFYRRHEGQEINKRLDYLSNNYLYLRDALIELPLPLNPRELSWIKKKSKRRFIYNIIKYFLQTKYFGKTNMALHKANFGIKDAFEGIFH